MEKSKLGISISLFAALLYFLGATSNVLAVAVAVGYVLLFEESGKLKNTAVKALILTVFLAILTLSITWLMSLLAMLLSALNVLNYPNLRYNYLYQFLSYISQSITPIMRIFEILIPVIFGFRAYRQKEIKIKWIDKILDKHFNFSSELL